MLKLNIKRDLQITALKRRLLEAQDALEAAVERLSFDDAHKAHCDIAALDKELLDLVRAQ